ETHIGERRRGESRCRIVDVDLEALLAEHCRNNVRTALRFVPDPPAPDDQCFAHCLALLVSPVFRTPDSSAYSPGAPAGSQSQRMSRARTTSGMLPSPRVRGKPVPLKRDA